MDGSGEKFEFGEDRDVKSFCIDFPEPRDLLERVNHKFTFEEDEELVDENILVDFDDNLNLKASLENSCGDSENSCGDSERTNLEKEAEYISDEEDDFRKRIDLEPVIFESDEISTSTRLISDNMEDETECFHPRLEETEIEDPEISDGMSVARVEKNYESFHMYKIEGEDFNCVSIPDYLGNKCLDGEYESPPRRSRSINQSEEIHLQTSSGRISKKISEELMDLDEPIRKRKSDMWTMNEEDTIGVFEPKVEEIRDNDGEKSNRRLFLESERNESTSFLDEDEEDFYYIDENENENENESESESENKNKNESIKENERKVFFCIRKEMEDQLYNRIPILKKRKRGNLVTIDDVPNRLKESYIELRSVLNTNITEGRSELLFLVGEDGSGRDLTLKYALESIEKYKYYLGSINASYYCSMGEDTHFHDNLGYQLCANAGWDHDEYVLVKKERKDNSEDSSEETDENYQFPSKVEEQEEEEKEYDDNSFFKWVHTSQALVPEKVKETFFDNNLRKERRKEFQRKMRKKREKRRKRKRRNSKNSDSDEEESVDDDSSGSESCDSYERDNEDYDADGIVCSSDEDDFSNSSNNNISRKKIKKRLRKKRKLNDEVYEHEIDEIDENLKSVEDREVFEKTVLNPFKVEKPDEPWYKGKDHQKKLEKERSQQRDNLFEEDEEFSENFEGESIFDACVRRISERKCVVLFIDNLDELFCAEGSILLQQICDWIACKTYKIVVIGKINADMVSGLLRELEYDMKKKKINEKKIGRLQSRVKSSQVFRYINHVKTSNDFMNFILEELKIIEKNVFSLYRMYYWEDYDSEDDENEDQEREKESILRIIRRTKVQFKESLKKSFSNNVRVGIEQVLRHGMTYGIDIAERIFSSFRFPRIDERCWTTIIYQYFTLIVDEEVRMKYLVDKFSDQTKVVLMALTKKTCSLFPEKQMFDMKEIIDEMSRMCSGSEVSSDLDVVKHRLRNRIFSKNISLLDDSVFQALLRLRGANLVVLDVGYVNGKKIICACIRGIDHRVIMRYFKSDEHPSWFQVMANTI